MTRRRPALRHLALLLLTVMASVAACASKSDEPMAGYLPDKPATVTVSMADYRFVYANRVSGGRVVFTVSNAGRFPHRLSLFQVPDEAPPVDVQLRSPAGLQLAPLLEMPVMQPGEAGASFAVDLEVGARYAMVSLWPSPQDVPDALLGMTTEFRAVRRLRTAAGQGP